jgi:hypothetical protein
MPVTVSISFEATWLPAEGLELQYMQSRPPGASRRPQVLHNRRASHSGHRFQFSLTSFPQSGQDRATSRNSQAGQIFQPAFVGSPQLGQVKVPFSGDFMVRFLRERVRLPGLMPGSADRTGVIKLQPLRLLA